MSELSEPARPATPEEVMATGQSQHTAAWSVRKCAEHAASVALGQFVFKKLHNALWCIENTLKFLPMADDRPVAAAASSRAKPATAENSDSTKSSPPPPPTSASSSQQPIRPLPWLLFLPTLIACKVAMMTANGLARAVHHQPLTCAHIVTRIQAYRRDLRAIRQTGQRIMRLQGKRNRLGPLSRLARMLSESLIRMRPAQQSGIKAEKLSMGNTMSRKTSHIDVNVDLASALNQSYNESDDLNDATFCPDESMLLMLDDSHDLSIGNETEDGAANNDGEHQHINDGSRAADASDEHESSAGSEKIEMAQEPAAPVAPALAQQAAAQLEAAPAPSPGFAGRVQGGGRIRMYANNGESSFESVMLQPVPPGMLMGNRYNNPMQIFAEAMMQPQNMQ